MIIGAVILGLIIIGLHVLINSMRNSGYGNMNMGIFFGALIAMFYIIEICIVSNIIEEPKPKAMDVYQGKTILEYTIRDGEVIDSVVVWKGGIDNED